MDKNVFLKGTSGEVFLNNTKLVEINKISAKLTGKFEDVVLMGEYPTNHVYVGYDGAGTLEGVKINTGVDIDIIKAYQKGTVPEFVIYSTLTNPNTGKTERYMLLDVQFTEVAFADWEAQKVVTRSMPFTFTRIQVLSTID